MSFIADLRCTLCRSASLGFAQDVIACRDCGQVCPVLGGVPVMFEAVSVSTGPAVDAAAARQLLSVFDLQEDALSVLRVRTLLRQQVRFGGSLIQVEGRQFLDRVRNSGHRIADDPSGREPAATPGRSPPRDIAAIPRYGWPKNYLPRRVQAGCEMLANMRIENRGDVPLYRAGAGRVMVATRWQHRDGGTAATPDARTPLPIDLLAGQAVTVAVRLAPPSQPGSYRLTLLLVQEQVRWLDADAITMTVSVERAIPGPVPDGWTLLADPPESYDADHLRGRALLQSWLGEHLCGIGRRPRVLEVGGNAVPMCAGLAVDLVNVDVDLIGLQIGRMIARQRGIAMDLICADAFNLPFAAGAFDAIVVFASLHHFPDPASLLEQLARKLRPGGFIGLFCEPVGHVWPGATSKEFLAELEKGVNEQSFSLREYELMFRQADLRAEAVVIDFNSLKARLVHPSGNGPA